VNKAGIKEDYYTAFGEICDKGANKNFCQQNR
jgi:hypothetical protein